MMPELNARPFHFTLLRRQRHHLFARRRIGVVAHRHNLCAFRRPNTRVACGKGTLTATRNEEKGGTRDHVLNAIHAVVIAPKTVNSKPSG